GVQELVAMASRAHGVDRIEALLNADSSMATSFPSQATTPHVRADDVPRPVVVRTDRYPDGNRMGAHEHRKAQLVYSPDGVWRVGPDAGTFVVPPEWAVWVPSWVGHDVQASAPLTLRSVYVEPESATNLPDRCCVVSVPPLLRELILESAALPDLYEIGGGRAPPPPAILLPRPAGGRPRGARRAPAPARRGARRRPGRRLRARRVGESTRCQRAHPQPSLRRRRRDAVRDLASPAADAGRPRTTRGRRAGGHR